ncbi:MAG: hypothetical protein ACR2O4_04940 [Hyphomicrobiaceae bacterium]
MSFAFQFIRKFRSDENGTVAIVFGLIAVAFLAFGGISVDMARTYGANSQALAALDSAILAAGQARNRLGSSDAELQIFAQRQFDANIANAGSRVDEFSNFTLTISDDGQTFTGAVDVSVPTYFAGLVNHDSFDFTASSTATFDTKVVELAMMLDITGSMRGTKIDGLRLAAKDVVDLMIADSPRAKSNRIALAPYAAAVNAGSLSSQLTAPGNGSVDGCVVGRDGANAATEAAPGVGTWLTAGGPAAPLADIDPTEGTGGYSCPDVAVMPLSDSKTDLKDRINDFTDRGWTAGHLGAAWGWYLLSPQWSSVFDSDAEPAPYTDDETIKAVLLMTDGIFNTRYIGSSGDTSESLARTLCANMRTAGIQVYAVAFDAPADAEATLRACASSIDHYFEADNTQQLRAAFRNIASDLTSLRLTK